jgi:hypothetical protein
MTDDFENQDWVKFGVAAALTRQYGADERQFMEELATMLENAMPGEVELKKHGGLFSKKTLQAVSVTLEDYRYTLEDPGHGPLRATRTKIVRGIALKTEEMTISDWLEAFGEALENRMRVSSAAREALSRLVDPLG